MAERIAQSWTTVPHFFLIREVDAGTLYDAREELNAVPGTSASAKITHTDLLIAIVSRVLLRHPRLDYLFSSSTSPITRLDPKVFDSA